MSAAFIFLFTLVLVSVTVIGVLVYYLYKKRQQALAHLAASLGFKFTTDDIFGIPERYDFLGLFQWGHSREARNIIYGSRDGAIVYIFDYYYVTGSGRNRSVHRFNCCIVEVGVNFPRLRIRKERWYDKVAAVIGFDDIDFESAEFSRRFFVKSSDRKFAYEVINQQMMEFLLASPRCPFIELQHDACLFYFKARWKVDIFRHLYEFAFAFLKRVPDWVLQKYGRR